MKIAHEIAKKPLWQNFADFVTRNLDTNDMMPSESRSKIRIRKQSPSSTTSHLFSRQQAGNQKYTVDVVLVRGVVAQAEHDSESIERMKHPMPVGPAKRPV